MHGQWFLGVGYAALFVGEELVAWVGYSFVIDVWDVDISATRSIEILILFWSEGHVAGCEWVMAHVGFMLLDEHVGMEIGDYGMAPEENIKIFLACELTLWAFRSSKRAKSLEQKNPTTLKRHYKYYY